MNRLLTDADHEVILAANGREAVDLLKEQSFDVVLSDVDMPYMSGFDLFNWIRAERPDLVKKFILTSASLEITPQLSQTPVKFIPKPSDIGTIRSVVNEVANA